MKTILPLLILSLFFFSGCAKKYSYPNYEIIEPTKTCKPNRKNIQKLLNKHLDKPYVWVWYASVIAVFVAAGTSLTWLVVRSRKVKQAVSAQTSV